MGFANFQLSISITVDANPWQIYKSTFRKGSKRAITLKKIKIFKKVKNEFSEHHCPNIFANFQREILITAESTLKTNYQRSYAKKIKKGHNFGKNQNFKKIKKL